MRSVVLNNTRRCPVCRLTPRWCVCPAFQAIACPLEIDVLMHFREHYRPTSTGHLVNRIIPASRNHPWRHERPPDPATFRVPGRELWILHPAGEPFPHDTAPGNVQVLLLDGSWREASTMARTVGPWGRPVSLPMTGESRYWLRAQQDGGRFSTIEALLFLLQAFGLDAQHATLRLQFELHVYASLRARGSKDTAREFLRDSPVPAAFPELLAQFEIRRPHEAGGR